MLSWLPVDTESITAATGPFVLPRMTHQPDGSLAIAESSDRVDDALKQYALLQLLPLAGRLGNTPVLAAIEGSRNFKQPSGLGLAPFEGAAIAILADDVTSHAAPFTKSDPSFVQTKQIEGQSVAIFKQKSEEDIWTTYVVFPKPNVVVVATDEAYLREVLKRIATNPVDRALPDSLPEWKHVNMHAPYWAVRHFHNPGKPSFFSGFSIIVPETRSDEQAIGLTFSFDPTEKTASITFLTPNETTLQAIQKGLIKDTEQGGHALQLHYRETEPGILEGTYRLEQADSAQYFMFVLEALLGHVIFI